ncbi:hypothetical protein VTK73DRAFT_4237 [Phialemonium thermophilum]|uniref:Rhamnogalacturonan acetylesterase n=1 Tax=Phialemonium thermophilum TaxID=223376 RepID=A0ABR3VAP8_9PEZI
MADETHSKRLEALDLAELTCCGVLSGLWDYLPCMDPGPGREFWLVLHYVLTRVQDRLYCAWPDCGDFVPRMCLFAIPGPESRWHCVSCGGNSQPAGSVQFDQSTSAKASPTIYLAGDSTMAKLSGPINGWGEYLHYYVTVPVVNKAIAGRSARSFSEEGRFKEIETLLRPGDIVVVEFGHNDGGSPTSAADNGRSDCPGTGSETCRSGKTGDPVYTFSHYVEAAARSYLAAGAAGVVVSSQTPNNMWEGGRYNPAPSRFVAYAAAAAANVGEGASFVDHFQAVADMYLRLGSDATNALYPQDHTHTSPAGANLSAQAFAEAVQKDFNGTTPLKQYLKTDIPTVF